MLKLGKKAVVPPSRYEAAASYVDERLVAPAKEVAAQAWEAVPAEVRSRVEDLAASKEACVALAVVALLVLVAVVRLRSTKRASKEALDTSEMTALTRELLDATRSTDVSDEDEAGDDISDDGSVEESYREFLVKLNDCASSVGTDDAVQETETPASSPPVTPLRKGVSLKRLSSKMASIRRISSNASIASSNSSSIAGSMRSFFGSDSIVKKMTGQKN